MVESKGAKTLFRLNDPVGGVDPGDQRQPVSGTPRVDDGDLREPTIKVASFAFVFSKKQGKTKANPYFSLFLS